MTDRHDLLFIYGTLMSVAEHPLGTLLRDNARFVGAGSIQARLYSITEVDAHGPNTYPGALPSPDPADRVFGELWHVTNPGPVWPALDRHEACTPDWPEPHEFLLRPVPVTLDGPLGEGASATIRFAEPEFGVAPGQAAVIYAGDRVVGGGWIDSTTRVEA